MENKKTTIKEIKASVEKKGGEFVKCDFRLNSNSAFEVNGIVYTKPQLLEAYKMGML